LRSALEQKMMPFYFLGMPMMRGFENEPEYIELRKKVGLNQTSLPAATGE